MSFVDVVAGLQETMLLKGYVAQDITYRPSQQVHIHHHGQWCIVCFLKPHEYSSNFCTNLEGVGETCTLTLFQRSIQQDHIKAVCRMRTGGKTLNACQGHGSEEGQAKRTGDTENTSAVTDVDTNAQAVSNIPSALKECLVVKHFCRELILIKEQYSPKQLKTIWTSKCLPSATSHPVAKQMEL